MVSINLDIIESKLNELKSKNRKKFNYFIPSLWNGNSSGNVINVNPFEYYLGKIKKIKELASNDKVQFNSEKWSDEAIVYNMLLRYTTAFDHDGNGKISSEILETDFRELGTFLKAIALIPYFLSIGINTIYLLPITSIGIDRKKGTLGSPYAIRNPYKIDENLSEPILELDSETEFKAFSEALHIVGIKLVVEFVFRTASVDSDLALEHPNWFYWINNKVNDRGKDPKNEKQYGPPVFSKAETEAIKKKVESGDFNHLPEPHDLYKNLFTQPPIKLARVEKKIVGLINDKKVEVRIPSAFADWPTDDTQPVWSDVTYLRLYEAKGFNYIAYNTIRMYDNKLAKPNNKVTELWDYITGIVPYYQKNFWIDGVMIDMGHALPGDLRHEIVKKARENNNNFIFWEENFTLNEKSKTEGYDAVVGYMMFDQHLPLKLKQLIKLFENGDIPVNFFATPENHNTPRAASRTGNIEFSKCTWLINKFLPAISFIHTGFELGETNPINTGLGFEIEDYEKYPADKLPLFSEAGLNWNSETNLIDFIKQINAIHKKYIPDFMKFEKGQIVLLNSNDEMIISFIYRNKINRKEILIAANLSEIEKQIEIDVYEGIAKFIDELTNSEYFIESGKLKLTINSYGRYCGELVLAE
jgi:glycosidase